MKLKNGTLTIVDHAQHLSIEITNKYIRKERRSANPIIAKCNGHIGFFFKTR
ncbi:hypothetical protein KL86DYS1_12178 [uncultured Dysgonomonas sp.]|uniref:Uncharacterized protein n=1 Tax=uncultured Dysgonomonas sp. TaxID=206096 RepID=A0A212JGA3_9BACT|nr:hypothetical protein KL86DYS1_12178 [uncultured Dysgonomonas sp.]